VQRCGKILTQSFFSMYFSLALLVTWSSHLPVNEFMSFFGFVLHFANINSERPYFFIWFAEQEGVIGLRVQWNIVPI
jgi:hypothetical protein